MRDLPMVTTELWDIGGAATEIYTYRSRSAYRLSWINRTQKSHSIQEYAFYTVYARQWLLRQ